MVISKKINDLRKKRNLKIKEMAELLKIPESTYRGYEYGSKLPADLVPGICQILGVSFEDFYGSSEIFFGHNDASILSIVAELEDGLERLKDNINLTISKS